MAEQLGLNLPGIPALGRDDFLVAPSNALAVALIDAWPDWQAGKLVLTGPQGSGKTHLAHVWAARSGATLIAARDIAEANVPALASGPVAVEDVPEAAGLETVETALFHLHNLALASGQTLMFTGAPPLAAWPMALPDLKSRLQGAASAELAPPDDMLLAAVLAKLFADRQLTPRANVIAFLVPRMDRSFAAARRIVERLDQASLGKRRPITRTLAREVLDNPA
jgi:chromosomal replication initiation ATPase DnaA